MWVLNFEQSLFDETIIWCMLITEDYVKEFMAYVFMGYESILRECINERKIAICSR